MSYTAIKRGVVAWLIAGTVLIAWTGGARVYNSQEESRVADEVAQVEREDRFYRIVAGQDSGGPTPADKLARDLSQIEDPTSVAGFKGDSNRYAGITDSLGFDPFQDGDNCPECGFLDTEVALNVATIKGDENGLTTVLVSLQEEIPPAKSRSGPAVWAWIIWVLSLPTYAVVMYMRLRKSEEVKWREVAQERNLVEEMRKAQHELPPGSEQWNVLDNLADELEDQMARRLQYRDTKTRAMRLEYLTSEATQALEAFEAGNKELT